MPWAVRLFEGRTLPGSLRGGLFSRRTGAPAAEGPCRSLWVCSRRWSWGASPGWSVPSLAIALGGIAAQIATRGQKKASRSAFGSAVLSQTPGTGGRLRKRHMKLLHFDLLSGSVSLRASAPWPDKPTPGATTSRSHISGRSVTPLWRNAAANPPCESRVVRIVEKRGQPARAIRDDASGAMPKRSLKRASSAGSCQKQGQGRFAAMRPVSVSFWNKKTGAGCQN